MTMFKSDVQIVRLFHRYSYEMLLLLDDCSVNDRLIKVAQFTNSQKSFFQMVNDVRHQSGNDTLALAKCARSRSQPVIRTIYFHNWINKYQLGMSKRWNTNR